MAESLTKREAYAAMFVFLDEIYQRIESADLGAILGGMSLLKDGGTADPAAWEDWEAAVRKVKERKANLELDLRDND